MGRYRLKTTVVNAQRWQAHGDHPEVRRYYKNPGVCPACRRKWEDHGWVSAGRNFRVCPGDWIVADSSGEITIVQNQIFVRAYESIPAVICSDGVVSEVR